MPRHRDPIDDIEEGEGPRKRRCRGKVPVANGAPGLKGVGWEPEIGSLKNTVEISRLKGMVWEPGVGSLKNIVGEYEDPGRYIATIFLLCSWGSPFWGLRLGLFVDLTCQVSNDSASDP